ncbi:MAG: hypothetical protein CMO06_09570 [Thalassospira sp.]|uniref:hypothetical protein n=1 Tax=Thalassospira sp. TaxID=1912094 RepID=UPI000C67649E|nr:hypothetical protein [Thalassospira sp.]MAZ33379.1 hypothetical protein [Thalassospira sp.]
MKTTDKLMLWALGTSAILTGLIYWWIPDMHWGVYLGIWFVISAGGYQALVKQKAEENQANQGDMTGNT